MKTPNWGQIEDFCRIDAWDPVEMGRSPDHRYYRKVLADHTVLETRVSHSTAKTMSRGRWQSILRDQLKVSAADFWQALQTKKPVQRPVAEVPEAPRQVPAGIHRVLRERLHMPDSEIAKLSADEAIRRAQELWSQPPPVEAGGQNGHRPGT